MVVALKHPKVITDKVIRAILRENDVLLFNKVTKAPITGVSTSSKCLLQEQSILRMVHTRDGFDPEAYKLMEDPGYDFSKSPSPGNAIDAKPIRAQ